MVQGCQKWYSQVFQVLRDLIQDLKVRLLTSDFCIVPPGLLWLWFVAPHCVMYCTWCPNCTVYCIINRILQLAQNCLIGECEMTAYVFVSSGLFLIFGYASVSSIWSSWLVASFRTSISLRLADKVCWRKSTKRGQINSTGEQSYITSLKIFWIYG